MQLPSLDVSQISASHPAPIPIFSGFRNFTQVGAIPPRNHRKNLVSCKRNRFQAINSSTQEKEAQISPEKEDVGNVGGGSPSTSFLSLLCPLLKLFSVRWFNSGSYKKQKLLCTCLFIPWEFMATFCTYIDIKYVQGLKFVTLYWISEVILVVKSSCRLEIPPKKETFYWRYCKSVINFLSKLYS